MIAEVINLDLRERGALFTLVDLMYIHGGSVPDEDDFMRRYLGCNMPRDGTRFETGFFTFRKSTATATVCCAVRWSIRS